MGEVDLNAQNQNPVPENQPVDEVTPTVATPENPVEPTEPEVEQPVEEAPSNEEPAFVPHGQVDPSFNCQPCQGEGLVNNTICINCNGTGKVKQEAVV